MSGEAEGARRLPSPALEGAREGALLGEAGQERNFGQRVVRFPEQLLSEFAARVETFEPAERESYVRSSFVSGIKKLPIRVTKRA